MARFILRRLAIIPLALILVHFLGFSYAHIARPIRARRTPYQFVLPESSALLPAYTDYIQNALQLDFGIMPVTTDSRTGESALVDLSQFIGEAALNSLGLIGIALALSVTLGLILGFRAAYTNPPGVARWMTIVSTVGLAMPSFYIGSLFIVTSILYILWRGPGTQSPLPFQGFGWDLHLVFPSLALMLRPTVQIARLTSSLISDEFGKQYVVAARSFGHSWRTIRWRHALRNVLAPVILTIASSFRLLVGELILVEWLFQWPGLGRLLGWTLVPALLSNSAGSPLFLNPPVVAALLTTFAALFLFTDFTASILVRIFDPRLTTSLEGRAHG